MLINILTLFPQTFSGPFQESILKRAQNPELHNNTPPLEIRLVNIRDFATDKHHITDDRPYGGGAGMVMKIEPIDKALQALKSPDTSTPPGENIKLSEQRNMIREGLQKSHPTSKIILTSAKGRLFTQQVAQEYAQLDELTIICGHYEGVDQRVADHLIDEEVRIGDYVLTGGEPAAIVITDAVARLLPGVLGNDQSAIKESHSTPGYFEHPQYTRPEDYKGWKVPEILLSGHHGEIEKWRDGK